MQVFRPIARLGGIQYGRTTDIIELPRPDWEKESKNEYVAQHAQPKHDDEP
jgi:hypothetical protein